MLLCLFSLSNVRKKSVQIIKLKYEQEKIKLTSLHVLRFHKNLLKGVFVFIQL